LRLEQSRIAIAKMKMEKDSLGIGRAETMEEAASKKRGWKR
jgi:hypothetical protein